MKKFLVKNQIKEENLSFLYNGCTINKELDFKDQANEIDKGRGKMNVIVTKINEESKQVKEILSQDIICPICKENALIDFYNLKIRIYGCSSNHGIYNLSLDKFEEIQKIDLSEIKCECGRSKNDIFNNEFYICINCNINLCPLCKSIHNKNHKIINYDEKNYKCKSHNDSFVKYCYQCKKDLCMMCSIAHQKSFQHSLQDFQNLLTDKNELNKTMENLKNVINQFKNKINNIKYQLDRMINRLDLFYQINTFVINNYETNKRNYHKLYNIHNLNLHNKTLIDYLNKIINNKTIFNVYKFQNDSFLYDNEGIYIGEMRNNLTPIKDGKGILFYNNGNKYEGDFNNGKKEGKGIIYFNNGEKYKGDFKNDKMVGNGKVTVLYNDGNKYVGDYYHF